MARGSARARTSRRTLLIVSIVVAACVVLAAGGFVSWVVIGMAVDSAKGKPDTTPVAAAADAPAAGDRHALYSLGHTSATLPISVPAPGVVEERVPFIPSVDATRYRLVIRNLDYRGDQMIANPVQVNAVYLGKQGAEKGSFDGAATARLSAGGKLTDGKALVTDWFDASAVPMTAGTSYLLGVSFSAPTSTQIGVSPAVAWVRSGVANGPMTTQANRGQFTLQGGYLDIAVEYAFDDPEHKIPVVSVLGHSLNAGANQKVSHEGEISSWHQQWARQNGGVASSLAAAGSWTSNFLPDSPKWQLAPEIDADYVAVWASSSDLVAGTSVNDVGAAWVALVGKAQQEWPNAKIIAFTEPPRGAEGEGEEARNQWNAFLRTNPSQVACVVDVDRAVADPADPHVLNPKYNGDGSHMTPAGNAYVAELFQEALSRLNNGESCLSAAP